MMDYLLSKVQHLGINLGLHREDGLGYSTLSARNTENVKKKICQIFGEHGLKILAEANLRSVDFLDIHLDLDSETYRPFMKPNGLPIYVNSESNHPSKIIKNIPISVNTRLSKLSTNEEVIRDTIKPYQEALEKSGYKHQLKYDPQASTTAKTKSKERGRKITYFNPPYSAEIKTNVSKLFFKIIRVIVIVILVRRILKQLKVMLKQMMLMLTPTTKVALKGHATVEKATSLTVP